MPPITLNGDTGIQTPMYNGTITANAVTPSVNMKNRIINGAMTINQRGFSGTANTAGGYGLDRFAWRTVPSLSAFSISQSTDAPAGFANSMLITSLASTSVGSGDYYTIGQQIEASNAYDFAFGTANAKSITLSFWVKSSLTGTFAGGLNEANSGSVTYGFTYSIPVANTWTYISIPVSGATIGTWNTSTLNSYFLVVNFSLGVGSNESTASNNSWLSVTRRTGTGGTNLVSTNGATFYITGVQLEVGSTATSFDYRPYGTELALAQRYYEKQSTTGSGGSQADFASGIQTSTTQGIFYAKFNVTKRATPTATISNVLITDHTTYGAGATLQSIGKGYDTALLVATMSANGAQYRPAFLGVSDNTLGYIDFSAEL